MAMQSPVLVPDTHSEWWNFTTEKMLSSRPESSLSELILLPILEPILELEPVLFSSWEWERDRDSRRRGMVEVRAGTMLGQLHCANCQAKFGNSKIEL